MEIRSVVDWCTSIPLGTLLERLVTAAPGTEMIEYDPVRLHKMERLASTTAADGTSSTSRDTAPA